MGNGYKTYVCFIYKLRLFCVKIGFFMFAVAGNDKEKTHFYLFFATLSCPILFSSHVLFFMLFSTVIFRKCLFVELFQSKLAARFARVEVRGLRSRQKIRKRIKSEKIPWMVEVDLQYNFSTKFSNYLKPILLLTIFWLSFYVYILFFWFFQAAIF